MPAPIVDRTGKKYNNWTVLRFAGKGKAGKHARWWAICDCGREAEVSGGDLHKRRNHHCRECSPGKPEKPGKRGSLYSHYRNSAHRRGHEFNISLEDFTILVGKNCQYCGTEPGQSMRGRKLKHNGIDRVDNSKGYVLENCVPCCGLCNRMKHALGIHTFLEHVSRIANYCKINNLQ